MIQPPVCALTPGSKNKLSRFLFNLFIKESPMPEVRQDWLKLTPEGALDTALQICDAHHHLWYRDEVPYTLDNLLQDISGGHQVTKTVFIESRMMLHEQGPEEMKPVGETEYVQRVAARSIRNNQVKVAAGIVGYADLTLGQAVMPVLEAHISAARGRFRGIRQTAAKDPYGEIKSRQLVPDGLMLDARFREGFACLKKYNLSFDAWLFHPQLADLADLAKFFPDTTIVLDHAGGPLGIGHYAGKRELSLQEWKKAIAALAVYPNIFIKLGGLGMEINGFKWYDLPAPPGSAELARAYAPYVLHCIDTFGVSRCMFESNFPVDKYSCSYNVIWNAFKLITVGFSPDERKALFYDTACKVYRI
jgi:L-fuconolactonase